MRGMWTIEYEAVEEGGWGWKPWRPFFYSFGTALRVGMRAQLKNYLFKMRLRNVGTQATIPLDELLRFEITTYCVKTVHAI